MKLAVQTIRRYVLKREIPYHKTKKAVRFRLSEIERWIDCGGGAFSTASPDEREGDLFADVEALDTKARPECKSPTDQVVGTALEGTVGGILRFLRLPGFWP